MDLAGTGGGTVLMGGVQLPRDAAPGTLGTLYEAQGWVHALPLASSGSLLLFWFCF